MLLDFTRKSYSRIIVLFCATMLLLWLKQILLGQVLPIADNEATMPLTGLLKSFMQTPLLEAIYVAVITLISAVLLMGIVLKHDILRGHDYLAALIFILFCLALPSQKQVCGAHLAVFFCLLSFNRLLLVYNRTGKSGNFFLATLFIGIAGLFYPPALLFLPIFLLGIGLLKVANWRDFFLAIFGTITPFIFAASYYHLFNQDLSRPIDTIIFYFTPGTPTFIKELRFPDFNIGYIYAGYIILLTIISTISNVRGISSNIKTSRILGILRLAVGVLLIGAVIFPAMRTSSMFVLIGFPASILTTCYLVGIRRVKAANVQLILLIASFLLLQLYF